MKRALLALENGAVFYGRSIGIEGHKVGEVIFNTSMTGYQEILSDPSYADQIITFTYPHIGNVGVNKEDLESMKTWALGVVVRELTHKPSNWRAQASLHEFLVAQGMMGIAGVDTRQITRVIRENGAQKGCLMSGELDPSKAIKLAQEFSGLDGLDLASRVSVQEPYEWTQGTEFAAKPSSEKSAFHVVVYDFGVKQNILRMLVDRGCKLTVVPAKMPLAELKRYNPDGVFLSNGPGDPAACDYTFDSIRYWIDQGTPLFGICLGFQLLALSCGAKTIKMKFGHHGANHPVLCMRDHKVLISSQNHGFSVDETSLPANLRITHRSLFDNTLQGIEYVDKPAFGFQGHPEASPGPHDLSMIFDKFINMMRAVKE